MLTEKNKQLLNNTATEEEEEEEYRAAVYFQTSLLHRLLAQTLPDATPPIGKIQPFSKMAVTFEPQMRF